MNYLLRSQCISFLGMDFTPKLIVVSNRLPFILKRNSEGLLERKSSAGGLVTAVAPVAISGRCTWVGWPGPDYNPSEPIPPPNTHDTTPTAGLPSHKIVPVILDKETFNRYYNGCCNGTFWPLFHSMPDRACFCSHNWKAYCEANRRFGQEAVVALKDMEKKNSEGGTPIIWFHDYHLMVAPNTVRMMGEGNALRCKLGFFLHIPFPPWDIFRLFPWADEVLQGMLGNDMVGFHTEDYCVNFIDCCRRSLGCRVDSDAKLVEHGGRVVLVRAHPIGIPFRRFVQLAEEAPPSLPNDSTRVVLGVDRLDYTKGLTHRLRAFESLLDRYPQHRGKVVMLQIAVPSRTDVKEYQELKEEMDRLVGRINGKFTTPGWSPIRYIYGEVDQRELASFYRDSAVAFITPLRDGMNLVAKEFVACQINSPPGVLVISPFAGAGETMHEALLCNPYETEEAADVLHRAVTMEEDERSMRMNHLRRREETRDVYDWMKKFLKAMGTLIVEEGEDMTPPVIRPLTIDDFDQLLSKYVKGHKLGLLLDYDGTLAPLAARPELALLPEPTRAVLASLAENPRVEISIVSGRRVDDVKSMVGLDKITYAGSHGLEIMHADGNKFLYPMPPQLEDQAQTLLQRLQHQVCVDGSWVENKGVYLTWHYRQVPPSKREGLILQAGEIISSSGFIVGKAHMALEAKPPIKWDKGRASIYIVRTAFGLDWSDRVRIIYAGDDATDEDAIKALKGLAVTFRVTDSNVVKTVADRRLPSTDSVATLLHWVERHFTNN